MHHQTSSCFQDQQLIPNEDKTMSIQCFQDQEFTIPEDVALVEIISKLPINCLIKLFTGTFKSSSMSPSSSSSSLSSLSSSPSSSSSSSPSSSPSSVLVRYNKPSNNLRVVCFDSILRKLFPYDNNDANVNDDNANIAVDLSDDEIIFMLAASDESIFKLICLSNHNLAPFNGVLIPEDALDYLPLGYVDGLLLLRPHESYPNTGNTGGPISLWNLKTNSFTERGYSSPHFFSPIWPFRIITEHRDETFGCGYCAQSQNVKVVRITQIVTCRPDIGSYPCDDDQDTRYDDLTSWDGVVWDVFDDWFETERFFDPYDTILDMDCDNCKFSDATDDLNVIDPFWENCEYEVDIYSVSTDSWKRLVLDSQLFLSFSRRSFFYPQKGFTKETFSWLVVTYRQSVITQVKLLTLHMSSEVFHVTSLPDELVAGYQRRAPRLGYYPFFHKHTPIQFFNGTIGLFIPTLESSCFEIWLLLEYGVMESWTRLCTIGPFPDVQDIIGLWKNSKVFLESTSGEVLVADIITNQIVQNLHIQVVPGYARITPHLKT